MSPDENTFPTTGTSVPNDGQVLARRQAAAQRAMAQCVIAHENRSRRVDPDWIVHHEDSSQWAGHWIAHLHHPANGFDEKVPVVLYLRFAPTSPVLLDVYAKNRRGAFIGNDVSDEFLTAERVRHEQELLRATVETTVLPVHDARSRSRRRL